MVNVGKYTNTWMVWGCDFEFNKQNADVTFSWNTVILILLMDKVPNLLGWSFRDVWINNASYMMVLLLMEEIRLTTWDV